MTAPAPMGHRFYGRFIDAVVMLYRKRGGNCYKIREVFGPATEEELEDSGDDATTGIATIREVRVRPASMEVVEGRSRKAS